MSIKNQISNILLKSTIVVDSAKRGFVGDGKFLSVRLVLEAMGITGIIRTCPFSTRGYYMT